MEILEQFGLKPELLFAQIVNFLILLFILNRFLYKPLLKVLDVRRQKIAESLKNAEDIEKRLEKISKEQEEALEKTAKEVKSMMDDASKTASAIVVEARQKAAEDAKRIISRTESQIKLEGDKMRQEIREELATLVVIGIQKVTGKVLTEKDQKALIEKSLTELAV